jgi:hypothetical protein
LQARLSRPLYSHRPRCHVIRTKIFRNDAESKGWRKGKKNANAAIQADRAKSARCEPATYVCNYLEGQMPNASEKIGRLRHAIGVKIQPD